MINETEISYKNAVGGFILVESAQIPCLKLSNNVGIFYKVFRDALSTDEDEVVMPLNYDGSEILLVGNTYKFEKYDIDPSFDIKLNYLFDLIAQQPHVSIQGFKVNQVWFRKFILNYRRDYDAVFSGDLLIHLRNKGHLYALYKDNLRSGVIAHYEPVIDKDYSKLSFVVSDVIWYEDGRIEVATHAK